MTKQTINIGTSPNDTTGDPLRTAFSKINANFTELYAGGASETQLTNGAYTVTLGSTGNLTWSGGAYIGPNGGTAGEIDIIAGTADGAASLGSNDLKNYLYVDNDGPEIWSNSTNVWKFGLNGKLTFPNNYTFTGQTLTDTSGTTNYSLKIANGTTGSIFAIGTGTDAYGVANDSLNHLGTGYVPYNATASTMSFNVPGYAGSLTINGAGVVTVPNGFVISGTGNLTFPDATVQTTAYTGTSITRSAGSIAGAGTVTLNYSTDRLVRATAAGSTLIIAHSNIAAGKVVDLVISNSSGASCTVTYGVAAGNTIGGTTTFAIGNNTTHVFTCRSFGTTTTDVYVTVV